MIKILKKLYSNYLVENLTKVSTSLRRAQGLVDVMDHSDQNSLLDNLDCYMETLVKKQNKIRSKLSNLT